MKKIYIILTILLVSALFPCFAQDTELFQQEGIASWYGREFDGRPTASGEIFDSSRLTAAHPSLPFGTMLIVTNLHNNKSVTVRINDRGPFVPARIIDISRAAAEQLDMIVTGTAPVKIESADRNIIAATSVGALQTPVVQPQVTPQVTPVVTLQVPPSQVSPQIPSGVITATSVVVPVVQTAVPEIVQPTSAPAPVFISQPVVVQPVNTPSQLRLVPSINIVAENNYRLQVGSFRVARNAVEAFERLKSAGLNPNYERHTDESNVEFYRVVIAGIKGSDVPGVSAKISAAGFREAIIREEN